MDFKIVGPIRQIEVIAVGREIRELQRLRKAYGGSRWRKLKGVGQIELLDGTIVMAELHWYAAHGIGTREMKVKRFLEAENG